MDSLIISIRLNNETKINIDNYEFLNKMDFNL